MALVTTVKVGTRLIDLNCLSGEVIAEKKWSTQYSSGGETIHHPDGSLSKRPTTTSTSTHDQVLLRSDDGKEHELQVSDVHLAVRPGHRLSLMWGIRKSKQDGPYVAVYNHDTGVRDLILPGMKKLIRPEIGIKTAIFLAAILIAAVSGTSAAAAAGPAIFLGPPLLAIAAFVRYFRRLKALGVEVDRAFALYVGSLPERPKPEPGT